MTSHRNHGDSAPQTSTPATCTPIRASREHNIILTKTNGNGPTERVPTPRAKGGKKYMAPHPLYHKLPPPTRASGGQPLTFTCNTTLITFPSTVRNGTSLSGTHAPTIAQTGRNPEENKDWYIGATCTSARDPPSHVPSPYGTHRKSTTLSQLRPCRTARTCK
jgi:hypothetical protein